MTVVDNKTVHRSRMFYNYLIVDH